MKALFSKKYWHWYVLLFGCLFVLWPLFRPGFFASDDGEWMIIRLSAFYQSLADGQFPVRFLGRLNHSYGYPVANFLYPGFLYIGSVIHFLGFSFVDSVKLILLGSIVGSVVFIYLWLRKWFDAWASAIGATNFLLAPYLVFDLYTRGSVGEILALFFVTLTIYAIEYDKKWLTPLSYTGLLVSHNTFALFFSVVLGLYMIIRGKIKDVYLLGLGIGLSCFFWLPALAERASVIFDSVRIANPSEYLLPGKTGWLIGVGSLVASVYMVFARRDRERQLQTFFLALFVLPVLLASPLLAVVWQWADLARIVQFPYRLLGISLFASAWMVAFALDRLPLRKNVGIGLLLFLISLGQIYPWVLRVVTIYHPDPYYSTNEATTTVHDEYMPKWVGEVPSARARERVMISQGSGEIDEHEISTQRYDITVRSHEATTVQINTIYYPGWGATMDGMPVTIDYANRYGVMRVAVPPGDHRITFEFRETALRFIADVLSGISILVYIGIGVYQIKKRYES